MVAPHGRLLCVLQAAVADDRIVSYDVIAVPERLRALSLAVLDMPATGSEPGLIPPPGTP